MTITQALHYIKDHLSHSVPGTLIRRFCQQLGYRWRERELGPVVTTHVFLQQILHGNTAVSHVRHLSGVSFTGKRKRDGHVFYWGSPAQGGQRAIGKEIAKEINVPVPFSFSKK